MKNRDLKVCSADSMASVHLCVRDVKSLGHGTADELAFNLDFNSGNTGLLTPLLRHGCSVGKSILNADALHHIVFFEER